MGPQCCGGRLPEKAATLTISVNLNRGSMSKPSFESHRCPSEIPARCTQWSAEVRWVTCALLGNSIIIWTLSQQTRKHLHSRGGRAGTRPSEGDLLCFAAFYKSHGKRDILDRKWLDAFTYRTNAACYCAAYIKSPVTEVPRLQQKLVLE